MHERLMLKMCVYISMLVVYYELLTTHKMCQLKTYVTR